MDRGPNKLNYIMNVNLRSRDIDNLRDSLMTKAKIKLVNNADMNYSLFFILYHLYFYKINSLHVFYYLKRSIKLIFNFPNNYRI